MITRLLALALLLPVAPLHAQPSATAHTRLPMILLGSGVATQNNSARAQFDTNAGTMLMIGVELPILQSAGAARQSRLALRAETKWSQQSLATGVSSGVSGDVQTMSAALLVRVAPFATPTSTSRLTPYLLAGAGVSRPSTRVSVFIDNADMPSAQFGQTSSEVAPTALGGAGAQLRVGRAQLFAEARTEFASLSSGTRRATFGTLGIVILPSR